jgi:hypothetical protein
MERDGMARYLAIHLARLATVASAFEASEQLRGRDPQSLRDLQDVAEADVALATFHGSGVGAVKPTAVTKLLLGQPSLLS